MSQTTYEIQADRAFAGMLAQFDATTKSSISRASEEAGAFGFGLPAVAGTDAEKQMLIPSGAGDTFLGVTVHAQAHQTPATTGIDNGETGEVLRRGKIWVVCESGCAVGDPVYWRHTTSPGAWRNAGPDSVLAAGASWATAAGAGELAIIDINLP